MISPAEAGQQLGIIELGAVCAAMRARNVALFEQLGRWVTDTTEPALQRAFAEACHRHAWHAELWERRAPTIPPVESQEPTTLPPAGSVAPDERAPAYTAAIDRLLTELDALGARIDPLLDPNTARVIGLVRVDLTELRPRVTDDPRHY